MNPELPPDQQLNQYSDEIDLRDVILPLWRCKYWILLWGALFSAAVFIYQAGGIVVDRSGKAVTSVHFNFQGADKGLYPNGATFSPQELVSNAVLGVVYKELIDPDIGYDNFVLGITLQPGFIGSSQLDSVVTDLIRMNKGLSVVEFNEAIDAYTVNMLSKSRTNIQMALDLKLVNGDTGLASRVLTRILQIWAKQALQDKGVLSVVNQPIRPLDLSDTGDEILVRANILADTLEVLHKQVRELRLYPPAKTVTDPESGQTLQDIDHLLNMEAKYKVSVLRDLVIKPGVGAGDKAWHEGFRKARLIRLEREKNSLERMVVIYDRAIIQFNQQQELDVSARITDQGTILSTQIYSPQYSDDLVSSLMQLGSKMADPEYRKYLLDKKIAHSSELQAVITEIEFYESGEGDGDENEVKLNADQINQLLTSSTLTLNELSGAVARIIAIVNERYLNDSGQLYDLFGKTEILKGSIMDRNIRLKITLAFIMGCFLAIIGIFISRVVRQPSTTEPNRGGPV